MIVSPYSNCVILGGGRHAAVLLEAIALSHQGRPRGILDPDRSLWGGRLLDVPILGGDEYLEKLMAEGVDSFVVGVGWSGDGQMRRRLWEMGKHWGLRPAAVCHRTAVVAPSAQVAAGAQLLAGSIVGTQAKLGVNVVVNTRAVVEHDCIVGDHSFVATGAVLCGQVQVGSDVRIGAGATVRNGVCIGNRAVIGAGAVVVRDVPEAAVVAGVPARLLRRTAA